MLRAPQGTAFGARALVPELSGSVRDDATGAIFVALASLSGEPDITPLTGLAEVTVPADEVDVRGTDGRTRTGWGPFPWTRTSFLDDPVLPGKGK
ncbi:MAG TPA: hypothetical protein VJT49_33875 [Amycolatopsis sp.]|uniref:hypothetical protein n=1 Tax=Amycolatopsis sp. TaxID=37632 RepID=UPI002B45A29C|nr:hypothetical protein [Amycolatopsis sp.]HKS50012.1 hypothetical protein [Amycolatopsis sp.]